MQVAGQLGLVPSHTYPAPHGAPAPVVVKVHPPLLLHPVHDWHACALQLAPQQLPLAPAPASAPQLKPDAQARQLASLHEDAVKPAVVSQGLPVTTRATHVPAPLQ